MAHPDSIIRIAMCIFLTAPDSALTLEQQEWLRARLQSRDPLSVQERTKLKGPLLAWCQRHGIWEKVAAQFDQAPW